MEEFFNNFFFGPGLYGEKDKNKRALFKKQWTAINTFYQLLSLVLNRYVYELPETMDARFLELCLLTNNKAAVAKVAGEVSNYNIIGFGSVNKYGYFENVNLADYKGKTAGRFIPLQPGSVGADCAVIYNDKFNIAPIRRIMWYADRLTELQTSISAAISNLKGSTIIRCTKEQKESVLKAWRTINNGAPIILSFDDDRGALQQPPEVISNPQTPEILISLQENYDKTIAQFSQEFGINGNVVVNKLSGISNNELAQNNELIDIKRRTDFLNRQRGLDEVNKLFGLDCKIYLNYEYIRPENADTEINKKGDDPINNDKGVNGDDV